MSAVLVRAGDSDDVGTAVGSGDAPASDPVSGVADGVVALICSYQRAKARLLAEEAHDAERSAHVLLRYLSESGPMRASAIAGNLGSDPSTVSRQVAALVRDGLVERRADPEDGRASILAVTPRADAVLSELAARRRRHFAGMLADWSDTDLDHFGALLRRFLDDFDRTTETMISERAASRGRSGEGNPA